MKNEAEFRKQLKKILEKDFFVLDTSLIGNEPGCFDLLCFRVNDVIPLELKIIKTMKSKKPISSIFEKTQIPFYKRWLKKNTSFRVMIYIQNIKKVINLYFCSIAFECMIDDSIDKLWFWTSPGKPQNIEEVKLL